MKKINNLGFMMTEILLVTIFVSGVLLYLFTQFSNLSDSYEKSYEYNTVEDLYALEDIKNYIETDNLASKEITERLLSNSYEDITNCTIFTSKNYCTKLFELENIDYIIVTLNKVNKNDYSAYGESLMDFVSQIKSEGVEPYRVIAKFKDSTYATVRFGEYYE